MKTNEYTYKFLNNGGRYITAVFKNGKKINFTTEVLNLLTSDPEVLQIEETKTGNILFYK